MKTITRVLFLLSILLAVNVQAGRWLSPDPIEHMERDPHPTIPASSGGQAVQVVPQGNLYTFVDNNPVNEIDPLGLFVSANPSDSIAIANAFVPDAAAAAAWNANFISARTQLADALSVPGNGTVGEVEGPLMGALKGSLNAATKKAASCGSKLHADRPGGLPDQLRSKYPKTEFKFTPPGKPGQDVQVVGGTHPSAYGYGNWPAGVDFGDFKPNTPGGLRTFNSDSQSKWNAPTTMLSYDPTTGKLVGE